MKTLNKITLVIFSIIILILGVVINLLFFGLLNIETVAVLLETMVSSTPINNVILVITEICILLALLAIFVDTSDKDEQKNGKDILMQNDNGKLMISRETIENLVYGVVKKFEGAKDATTKIYTDNENNILVLVDLTVSRNVVIKELTLNIQNKIKEEIKKTSDLDVKEVNVRIKNIESDTTAENINTNV